MSTSERFNVPIHVINIVSNSSVGKKVTPGRQGVKANELVEWKNLTNEPVRLIFPDFKKVFSDFGSEQAIEIPSKQAGRYTVSDKPTKGEYVYQVFGLTDNEYYQGDSDPRIDVL